MRCSRFGDVQSRDLRKSHDKLAAIREVFDLFVGNSKSSYNPSDYLKIDEQLVAFRGNCPFRQYIPSKASKYGIKVFALVSCSDFYTTNLEVYVGTQPDGPFKVSTKPHDLVMRLTEPVSGSKRNITADNWFVSLPLALDLLENRKLTLLGTMRGNKPTFQTENLSVVNLGTRIKQQLFLMYLKRTKQSLPYQPCIELVKLILTTTRRRNLS